jgi:spore coat polysaccharide biosynthesis protein SpsF (cytidylyltransferase family)
MKTVAIIQARMGSTRLPGKIMADLGGMPVLAWVVRAARAAFASRRMANVIDQVVVATTTLSSDAAIERWCIQNDISCYRGSSDDVRGRFSAAAKLFEAGTVVRLTADCPFLDPWLIGVCARRICSTTRYWPDGMDVQAFPADWLDWELDGDREHVIKPRDDIVQLALIGQPDMRHIRVTIDTAADLERARCIAAYLPPDRPPRWTETLDALRQIQVAA